ncbi:hypothetical protein BZL29_1648 [Mycobacterium kansasii]|uniref:Uncharacterized protein n=1 Tax=Mycobacterium kansasii TaxID=1768 RepID=A0A1V3XPI4_MYCKA|nr:hypothetical protein BZL29_1648 [Mycobacterium kansasii]
MVINAPSRLDMLTQQYVELTTRIAPASSGWPNCTTNSARRR